MDEAARPAGLREAGLLLSSARSGPAGARGRAGELAPHPPLLLPLRGAHGHRRGRHVRRCPACGAEHYPRTDPAVIMAGHRRGGPLAARPAVALAGGPLLDAAGFVEPGSPSSAVRREVAEEAGVAVGDVEYVASQPWPFPSSLMLGFMARATSPDIKVDGDEIEEARWFSRDELRAAIESGEVLPPSGISIAARLIELWYGQPLPTRSFV